MTCQVIPVNQYFQRESESEVTQSCPTLCDPMDYSLPGSAIHGIFQARVLEWIAISFSRGSSRPSIQTWVSRIAGRCFTSEPPGKLLYLQKIKKIFAKEKEKSFHIILLILLTKK